MIKYIDRFKYHYVYKVIHIPTRRYYIGIHSTNNLNDGYMGSGNIIRRMYKKYPQDEFCKEILFFGENRDEILAKEAELVTEDILIADPLILNLDIGGRSGNKTVNKGRFRAKDKYGNTCIITRDDPRYISGELVHVNAGKPHPINKKQMFKDGEYIMVPLEKIEEYKQKGWVLQSKCKGRISPTKNLTHIKKDEKEIMVPTAELQKYLDAGWVRGRIVSPCGGKIMIYKDGIDKYCSGEELQKYLDAGWVKGGRSRNKGLALRVNKETGEYVMLSKDDPRYKDPKYVGVATYNGSPAKGTKYMYKGDITKRISPDDVKKYLSDGWKFGISEVFRLNRRRR